MAGPRVLVINPSAEESLGVLEEPLKRAGAHIEELAAREVVDLKVSGEPSETATIVPSAALPRSARS